ncbi:TolC family protein [Lysobacter sp. S4-A87]|uniref:TolC family protein n=1 Tax=Lysobacter sp. S4-A87 TaxID=2925843 RepID=UPI001F536EE1|nr:TolC family protein [Lysobacter sp. S4-A87]UNK50056.1 TolC family protein [Lysobacter sp. S4-A87]
MASHDRVHDRANDLIHRGRELLVMALFVGAAGCANLTAPDDASIHEQALGAMAVPAEWSAVAATNAFRPQWLGDADEQLQALIDEAVAHNPDLRVAASRLEQARLQMRLAGADLQPTVTLGGKYANSLQPANGLDINGYGVVLNWELDLWGRARAEKKAGEAAYRSAEADFAYARQSLAAMTARAWLLAVEATRQSELATRIRDGANAQVELMARRERIGKVSGQDVAAARAQAQTFTEAAFQTEQGRQQALRTLELLVGRYPSASIAVPSTLPGKLDPIPVGVPSDVIARRPDLLAARKRYEQAFFNHEEARAARLPRIALNLGAGHLTSEYLQFKDGLGSSVYPLGGKLLWPLFDAGRLKTQVGIRDEQQREAAADYARTILTAFGEVESAMAADALLQQRERSLTSQVEALQQVLDAANVQLRIGKVDRYEVLDRELALDAARIALMRVATERRAQRANLHLALGGDFGVPLQPGGPAAATGQ